MAVQERQRWNQLFKCVLASSLGSPALPHSLRSILGDILLSLAVSVKPDSIHGDIPPRSDQRQKKEEGEIDGNVPSLLLLYWYFAGLSGTV